MAEAMLDMPSWLFDGRATVSTAGTDCPLPDNTAQPDRANR